MKLYVDTSLLVAWMTTEQRTAQAQAWFEQRAPGEVSISDWTITEFSAALSRKVRSDRLTVDEKIGALDSFREMSANTLVVRPAERLHFQRAALFADVYRSGLRSGDALHLALAAHFHDRLVTLDKRQAEAAEALGVASLLL